MTLAPSPELKLSLMVDAVARGVTATGGGVGELAFSMDSNFRLLIVDTIRFRRERERDREFCTTKSVCYYQGGGLHAHT